MEEQITSLQNPKIKRIIQLQNKQSERNSQHLFVVEGVREISHCINAGYEIDSMFYCEDITDKQEVSYNITQNSKNNPRYHTVSSKVYNKIAYRGSTEGVIALVKHKHRSLNDLNLKDKPLVLILEGIEKPGNIGAILRSADAAQTDAVIICDSPTDLYNPNLIRSSIGAVFTVPIAVCSSAECIDFLQKRKINILTAQLQDSKYYYDIDMTQPTAIVMGTESTGLTSVWRKAASAHILIPMLGKLDSLNVSVSAGILLFEAVRQRNN